MLLTTTRSDRHRHERPDKRNKHIGGPPLPGRRSTPVQYSTLGGHPNVLEKKKGEANFGPLDINNVLQDGCWKGRPCYVIGGGPSLKKFNWDRLKGHLTIGINRVFEKIRPSIIFSMDQLYWTNLESDSYGEGECGENVKDRFLSYNGIRLWMNTGGIQLPPDIYQIRKFDKTRMSELLTDGLGGGNNSGFGALNLAILLGADPIYLLGFDMKGNQGQNDWWHQAHVRRQKSGELQEHRAKDTCYEQSFIPNFNRVAPWAKSKSTIINLNTKSALMCFDKKPVPRTLKAVERPVVVSYYTKNTGYEQEVVNLKNSVMRYGLESDIVGIDSKGDWTTNCGYKPQFLLDMLEKYDGRTILWLDSDARIQLYPELFDNWDEEFALHVRPKDNAGPMGGEVMSGTILMRSTPKVRHLVSLWRDRCNDNPKEWDQRILQKILEGGKESDPNDEFPLVSMLPASYCCISDTMLKECTEDPVIVHYQASRRFRGDINAQAKRDKLAQL